MPRYANAAVLLLVLSCAACSRPQPPPTDEPPEPQARAATEGAQATELRDAIQQPIERAKAVEEAVRDAAEQQQAEIDAQTGG